MVNNVPNYTHITDEKLNTPQKKMHINAHYNHNKNISTLAIYKKKRLPTKEENKTKEVFRRYEKITLHYSLYQHEIF
jgi:hypothetical protein